MMMINPVATRGTCATVSTVTTSFLLSLLLSAVPAATSATATATTTTTTRQRLHLLQLPCSCWQNSRNTAAAAAATAATAISVWLLLLHSRSPPCRPCCLDNLSKQGDHARRLGLKRRLREGVQRPQRSRLVSLSSRDVSRSFWRGIFMGTFV